MGCGSVMFDTESEATHAERRVLIKRALRVALFDWSDGRNLLDSNGDFIGRIEVRGEPGSLWIKVIQQDYDAFVFKIGVI